MDEAFELDGFEGLEGEEKVSGTQPGVDEDTLKSMLKAAIDDAVGYAEADLAPVRITASKAYEGAPMDKDESMDPSRSRVISRDAHDTVQAIMPSLMRVFFSGREVVSYVPQEPSDEEFAKQATDYVNEIVLAKDNEGFLVFYTVFMDALIKGLGVFKWWWDEDVSVEARSYSGLDQATFQVLAGDPSVTNIQDAVQDDMGFIDCVVSRKLVKGGFCRVEAVPPEERLINSTARSIDGSTFYGHRRTMMVSDLVAMGFDFRQLVDLSGPGSDMTSNEEAVERYGASAADIGSDVSGDPSQREVDYVECYLRVDLDADGIAELYRISVGGSGYDILEYADGGQAIEMVDEIPFAEVCPYPEPHLATGTGVAGNVLDIQNTKTGLLRATLDSLSRTIFPREEVVEQQVNMDDVLNSEIGATIRVKAPGMIREIVTPFMGKDCMPVMNYMDGIRAERTGISETTQGLNPDSLQSTTEVGVQAAVTASQSQLELIARVLAQIGVVRLFKGLLRLIKTHQDVGRTVKLRGAWTEVDPRSWNAGMDAQVVTALGRGTDSEKMSMLGLISQKQELIMERLGPYNEICTPTQYRETLVEMVTLAGYYNPDRFFLPTDMGQVIAKMNQELEQAKQTAQQATEENQNLKWQLRSHSEAEDMKNVAEAGKKHAETFQTLVETAQTAALTEVEVDAAADEAAAVGPFVQGAQNG